MSTELFRYRGAAKDGGTLEYVFEADAAEIAADFMTYFYHVQNRCARNARVPDSARSVVAYLLFGLDQRTTATNGFRRSAAGWAVIGQGWRSGFSQWRDVARFNLMSINTYR